VPQNKQESGLNGILLVFGCSVWLWAYDTIF